jgi:hypothetical protein
MLLPWASTGNASPAVLNVAICLKCHVPCCVCKGCKPIWLVCRLKIPHQRFLELSRLSKVGLHGSSMGRLINSSLHHHQCPALSFVGLEFENGCWVQAFNEKSLEFQEKMVGRGGLGDETYLPDGAPQDMFQHAHCTPWCWLLESVAPVPSGSADLSCVLCSGSCHTSVPKHEVGPC